MDDNDEPEGNDGNPLLGLRKLDPLPTLLAEKRFLETAASQFWKGGCLTLLFFFFSNTNPLLTLKAGNWVVRQRFKLQPISAIISPMGS